MLFSDLFEDENCSQHEIDRKVCCINYACDHVIHKYCISSLEYTLFTFFKAFHQKHEQPLIRSCQPCWKYPILCKVEVGKESARQQSTGVTAHYLRMCQLCQVICVCVLLRVTIPQLHSLCRDKLAHLTNVLKCERFLISHAGRNRQSTFPVIFSQYHSTYEASSFMPST